VVNKLVKEYPDDFHQYTEKGPEFVFRNLDSLRKDLHSIDVNGDGKDDLIFDGQSSGEPRIIEIFISAGTTYKKVFS
jgi:hypothetical protein